MEAQPTAATLPNNSGGPSPAGGGGYPQWVILAEHVPLEDEDEGGDDPNSCFTADAASKVTDTETEAASRSSAGNHVGVSFLLKAPPAVSRLRFRCVPSGSRGGDRRFPSMRVVAVHRDSLLLRMQYRKGRAYDDDIGVDYFLYNAGAGATAVDPPRPPSLSLLPTYW